MKITIESTSKLVTLDGVPARVWEGKTESGIAVHAFITRVAIVAGNPETEKVFNEELTQCRTASAEAQAFPSRMVL